MTSTTVRTLAIADGTVVVYDRSPDRPPRGAALVVPPFGMASRDLLAVELALVASGVRSLRLDGRDSAGSGSGVMRNYALATVAADIGAAIGAFSRDGEPLVLMPFSLATRPALEVLAAGADVAGAVLVTPVVNVARTVGAVLEHDWFSEPPERLPDEMRVLGKRMPSSFVTDTIATGMHDLATSAATVARCAVPIVWVCGNDDPWVDRDDISAVTAGSEDSRVVTLAATTHELNRNPRVAMSFIEHAVASVVGLASGQPPTTVLVPTLAEVIEAAPGDPAR